MKEYLSKDYKLQIVSDINTLCEVPEGAAFLTCLETSEETVLIFWKEGHKKCLCCDDDWVSGQPPMSNYMDSYQAKIVWRREKTVEYLDPSDWSLKVVGENSKISGDWILVPEGAEQLTKSGLELVFWKDDGKFSWHTENSTEWDDNIELDLKTLSAYGKEYIVWQRHTQPEELPFIDDELTDVSDDILKSTSMAILLDGDRKRINYSDSPYEMETKSSFNSDDIKYMDGCAFGKTLSIESKPHNHYFKDVSGLDEIDVYQVLRLFNVTDPCLQHIVKKALCAGQRGHKDFETDLKNIFDTAKRALEINNVSHNQGS